MDIYKILELNFPDHQWAMGEEYNSLEWDENNSVPKPSLMELTAIWDSAEFKVKVLNSSATNSRKDEILSQWPIHKQFEAITELHMDRPEKMDELVSFISSIKEKYPKSQTP